MLDSLYFNNRSTTPPRKVILLDDQFKLNESERRLFYVGMTRAKEELILCTTRGGQFIKETGVNLKGMSGSSEGWSYQKLLYLDLTPRDVNLGYQPTRNQQEIIRKMQEGQLLQLRGNKWGGWNIFTPEGVAIGALSRRGNDELRQKRITPDRFQFRPGEVKIRYVYQQLDIDEVTNESKDSWFIVIPQIRISR